MGARGSKAAQRSVWKAAQQGPVELGVVHWSRDVDASLEKSKASRRPVLLLFQEVPGCSTCVSFGLDVLSLPLLIDFIEEAFVPCAVFSYALVLSCCAATYLVCAHRSLLIPTLCDGIQVNNRPFEDKGNLARFNEPSLNNPVVRFLDHSAKDVIPRKDGVYDPAAVLRRCVQALEAVGNRIPAYTALLQEQLSAERRASVVTVTMACFWEGEAFLGGLDGVVCTTAGWLGMHSEVVRVVFLPDVLPLKQLLTLASNAGVASHACVYTQSDEETAKAVLGDRVSVKTSTAIRDTKASDMKFHLRRLFPALQYVPLLPIQRCRINARAQRTLDTSVLSPWQSSAYAWAQEHQGDLPDMLGAGCPDFLDFRALAEYTARFRGHYRSDLLSSR